MRPHDTRFWRKVDQTDTCWIWIGARHLDGYGIVIRDGRNWLAHRWVWTIANGTIPGELCVCHHCDNPPCVRPDHLFLGTRADNNVDKTGKGRNVVIPCPGEANGAAKLTESEVLAIRAKHAAGGVSMRALGREYGVDGSAIEHIIHRRRWRHI
jgi:hypothetical protein